MDQNSSTRRASYPAPTFYARHASSQRIAAARVPTEPSEADLEATEQRLQLTAMRDRCTVPTRRAS